MKPFASLAEVRRWAWSVQANGLVPRVLGPFSFLGVSGPFSFLSVNEKYEWEDLTKPYTGFRVLR